MRIWISLVLAAGMCLAADGKVDRATLRGLKAVQIVIDPPAAALEAAGLRREALLDRIEGRLQNAGIKMDIEAREFLGLRISLADGAPAKGPFGVNVWLGVFQPVLLVRDQDVRTATETWESNELFMASQKTLFNAAMTRVDQLVDRFIRAYKSANPE